MATLDFLLAGFNAGVLKDATDVNQTMNKALDHVTDIQLKLFPWSKQLVKERKKHGTEALLEAHAEIYGKPGDKEYDELVARVSAMMDKELASRN